MAHSTDSESTRRRFPPPFVTPLSSAGLRMGLMLIRKTWADHTEHDRALRDLGLIPTSSVLETLTAQQRDDQIRNGRSKWYRAISDNIRLGKKLAELEKKRAALLGYHTSVLWANTNASLAYELLIDGIALLGSLSSAISPSERTAVSACILAARVIAHLTKCDCWTLYCLEPGQNLPTLVGSDGLLWPEALSGTAYLDSECRRRLLAPERTTVIEDVAPSSGQANHAGSFRLRECIASAWAVLLPTLRSRAVLYLNWRTTSVLQREAKWKLGINNWRTQGPQVDRRYAVFENGPVATCQDDLRLLLRYIRGWLLDATLTGAEGRVGNAPQSNNGEKSYKLIRAIIRCFHDTIADPSSRGVPLAKLCRANFPSHHLSRALANYFGRAADDLRIEVFTCVDDNSIEIPVDKEYRDAFGRRVPAGARPIAPEADGVVPVGSGLVAQCIAWSVSIVLEDLPSGPLTVTPKSVAPRDLAACRLVSNNWWARSEAAVPIVAGDLTIGGIAMMGKGTHTIGNDVRRLEVISIMTGALFDIVAHAGTTDEQLLVRNLFGSAHRPVLIDAIFSSYTKWLLEVTRADLAYVVLPDNHGDLRRCGISMSETLGGAIAILAAFEKKAYSTHQVQARAEEVIRNAPGPRHDGYSQEVFRTGKEYPYTDLGQESSDKELGDIAVQYLRGVACFPLRAHTHFAPIGVVWLGLGKASEHRLDVNPLTMRRVQRFSSLIGAIYMAYSM